MLQHEILKVAVDILNRLGIEYLVTGSIASSMLGKPRYTDDVDLLVALPIEQLDSFLAEFPTDTYYWSREAAARAVQQPDEFNIIDTKKGVKLDIWVLSSDSYSLTMFERRLQIMINGQLVNVCTPEDSIITKLHWSDKPGQSERQLTDALNVYRIQGPKIDQAYLTKWADWTAIDHKLRELRRRAHELGSPESIIPT